MWCILSLPSVLFTESHPNLHCHHRQYIWETNTNLQKLMFLIRYFTCVIVLLSSQHLTLPLPPSWRLTGWTPSSHLQSTTAMLQVGLHVDCGFNILISAVNQSLLFCFVNKIRASLPFSLRWKSFRCLVCRHKMSSSSWCVFYSTGYSTDVL